MGFSMYEINRTVAGTTTIISRTLPAGNYVLFATVTARTGIFDDHGYGLCFLEANSANLDTAGPVLTGAANEVMAMTRGIAHGGGAIELKCRESEGDFDVSAASLSAIKVDSLG